MDYQTPTPRRHRFYIPIAVIVLAIIAIVLLHQRLLVESYIAAYATAFVVMLATLLLATWFGLFSGFSARVRWRGVGAFVAVVIAGYVVAKLTTRVDGTVSGVGVPRLVWKWTPKAGQSVASMPGIVETGPPVDLTKITAQDFPQFLGPDRTNSIHSVGLSTDWKTSPRQLWRQPIGLGWGSFAIVGNWAITQEQRGQTEMIVCYEVETGKPRWVHSHESTRFSEWQGGDGPRATPTISGGRLYAMGATGYLDCLDGATGKEIWSRNVMSDTNKRVSEFGKSCSPLVMDDLVIVTGGRGGPSLVAYRKTDGTIAWTAGDESPGYASPVMATLAGVKQILTINSASAASYDAADGKLLWRYNWPGGMPKVPQPVPLDSDRVLITAGYGLGAVMLQVQSTPAGLTIHTLWNNRYLKPKMSNGAVQGNFVYGFDDGILTCLDLTTGKRMWRGDSYGFGQLLLVDNTLLIQAESGDVALVDAAPGAFHESARFSAIEGKTWNNPALSDHHLLVRNDHEAACYELP